MNLKFVQMNSASSKGKIFASCIENILLHINECIFLHVKRLYVALYKEAVSCFMYTDSILLHVYIPYFASCIHTVFCFMFKDFILLHVYRLYFASCIENILLHV